MQEDAEHTMDSEKDESGSAVNGWSHQGADDGNKEEADWLPGTYTERKQTGEELPVGYDGRKKSKRKTEDEIHGWNQRTHQVCEDG